MTSSASPGPILIGEGGSLVHFYTYRKASVCKEMEAFGTPHGKGGVSGVLVLPLDGDVSLLVCYGRFPTRMTCPYPGGGTGALKLPP